MACVQDAHALLRPVANLSLPANETRTEDAAWAVYLGNYSSEDTPHFNSALFNETATLEVVRDSLESCREWDNVCQDPSQIFANPVSLGICSLYPNSTAMIKNGSGHDAAVQDIGGVGMTVSYFMQTLIALLAMVVFRVIGLKHQPGKKTSQHGSQVSDHKLNSVKAKEEDNGHLNFRLRSLSAFHMAQCFYSIALQIAAIVAIYGKNKNREDDIFLILISANGLVPVADTLYTLLVVRYARLYDLILAGTSALLASFTAFSIIFGFSSTVSLTGSDWPASCGGLSPQFVCDVQFDFQPEFFVFGGQVSMAEKRAYIIGGAILFDIIVALLILSYFLPWLSTKIPIKIRYFSRLASKRLPRLVLVGLCNVVLSGGTIVELCVLGLFLSPDIALTGHKWSFGQIVGITVWSAVIVDVLRYEIFFLWQKRQNRLKAERNRADPSRTPELIQLLRLESTRHKVSP
ncbi:hypothetical protein MMC22_009748 [Lobaria immixta]|nr:hypothetical protein [Lobaria immixta]